MACKSQDRGYIGRQRSKDTANTATGFPEKYKPAAQGILGTRAAEGGNSCYGLTVLKD